MDGDAHKEPWRSLEPVWLLPSHGRQLEPGIVPADALRLLSPDAGPLDPSIAFQPTALRVCRSETHLYVAFQCVDRDIWGTLEGRNAPIYTEEVVEAFIAPGDDVTRYYELESSPRNAWFEARVTSPQRGRRGMVVDTSWVCEGWERAVRVRGTLDRRDDFDSWWSVEWGIPFRSLATQAPRPGDRWRANFYRIDAAQGGQFSAWSPTLADPPDFHVPDRFGVIVFE